MLAVNHLSLRSTVVYTKDSVAIPDAYLYTISSSIPVWTNTISVSTLSGSTMTTPNLTTSRLTLSTLTGSTLYGSTMIVSSIAASFITLSTLTVSSINNSVPGTGTGTSTGSFSTLSVSSLNAVSTITASSIIANTGNVGIGITNPGYALHVIGAIYASGNITALSDQRYKQNIVRLDHSLEKICQLSGYTYTRDDYQPGIRQIGLLAQEVNQVIPQAVSYDSTNDTYSLNYGCLMAPVIEAVKEINDKMDRHVRELERKIDTQQALIQQLLDRC